jgi:hypothetical protein
MEPPRHKDDLAPATKGEKIMLPIAFCAATILVIVILCTRSPMVDNLLTIHGAQAAEYFKSPSHKTAAR